MKPPASSANGVHNGVEAASTGGESRIRVYVRRSALDPKMWVVRPLTDEHAPPAGTRAGSLVIFGPDVDDDDTPSGSAV
jgi:hypothetical protein